MYYMPKVTNPKSKPYLVLNLEKCVKISSKMDLNPGPISLQASVITTGLQGQHDLN